MGRGNRKPNSTSAHANAAASVVTNHANNSVEEPKHEGVQPTLVEERAFVPEAEATSSLAALGQSLAEKVEHEEETPSTAACAIKEVTFIEEKLERVPVLGQHVATVFSNRYVQAIAQKVDPLVQSGVQKATPFVEGLEAITGRVAGVIKTMPGQLNQSVKEAPGRVSQTMKATPPRVYHTIVDAATSAAQKMRALPTRVYKAAMLTSTNMMDRAKAVPAKMSQSVNEVYETARSRAAHLVSSIKAAPGKVIRVASSAADSLATAVQPYVHRTVKLVAPRQHVQSMYQHRLVQGGIEKATPYVSKVAKQPAIFHILQLFQSVSMWALPPL